MTVGERGDELAQTYFDIYLKFKSDPMFAKKAQDLAEHDLWVKGIIAEFALNKLREMIAEHEKTKVVETAYFNGFDKVRQ
jgi:hypothetical protein